MGKGEERGRSWWVVAGLAALVLGLLASSIAFDGPDGVRSTATNGRETTITTGTSTQARGADQERTKHPGSAGGTERLLVTPHESGKDGEAEARMRSIVVRVRWSEDNGPAPNVVVQCLCRARSTPLVRRTDDAGELVFEGLPRGQATLLTDRGSRKTITVLEGSELVEFVLPSKNSVIVRVEDANGTLASDAQILSGPSSGGAMNFALGRTDARGALRLSGLTSGMSIQAVHPDWGPSKEVVVRQRAFHEGRMTLRLRETLGASVTGRVLDENGVPVNATVSVTPVPQRRAPTRTAVADPSGVFHLDGIPNGEVRIAALAEGRARWEETRHTQSGERLDLTIQLIAGASVHGRVLHGEQPGHFAKVWLLNEDRNELLQTVTNAQGQFTFDGVNSGSIELEAIHPEYGGGVSRLEILNTPCAVEAEVRLDRGAWIEGALLDPEGGPLPSWTVGLANLADESGRWQRNTRTDAVGRFRFLKCREQPYRLEVRGPETWLSPVVTLASEVFPDNSSRDYYLPAGFECRSRIHGRIVSAEGSGVTDGAVSVRLTGSPRSKRINLHETDGEFDVGPIPAGGYTLRFEVPKLGETTIDVAVGVGEQKDLGDISLDPAGTLRVSFGGLSGEGSYRSVEVSIGPKNGVGRTIRKEIAVREAKFPGLAAGLYSVAISGPHVVASSHDVEVVAGQEALLLVRLEPAVARVLHLTTAAANEASGVVELALVNRDLGTRERHLVFDTPHRGEFFWPCYGLLPGKYTFEAVTTSGATIRTRMTITTLEQRDLILEMHVE